MTILKAKSFSEIFQKKSSGSPVMGTPTKAHPNREAFFNRLDTVPFDELVFKYATVDKKREFKIKRNKVLSKLGILSVLKRLKKML